MDEDKALRELIDKRFQDLWNRLKIQRHITFSLSKKQNSKQALEKAEHFDKVVRPEIVDDLLAWYKLKRHFKTSEDETLTGDLLDRINGELAKIGVPFIIRDFAI
jgi:hypothetical protein